MKLDQYISELLYDHDCVIVSDLGGFIANYKPAAINPALHVISPPSKKLAFNASLKNNDGLLANHIARRTMLNYMDACEVIRDYVKEATKGMKEGQKLKIDKVGVLYLDPEERLQFLPDHHANYLIESFGMTPIHAPLIKRSVPETEKEESVAVRNITPVSHNKEVRVFKWKVLEMIPAAAVLAILIMTPPVLKEFNSNLSTLLPFSRMNEYLDVIKGEKQSNTQVVIPYTNPFEIAPANAPVNFPKKAIVSKPDMTPAVPVTADAQQVEAPSPEKTKSSEAVIDATAVEKSSASTVTYETSGQSYFIIGGCFRSLENAEKFVADMKSKGMDAVIIGQNKAGLHMVSLFSASSFNQATDALPEIKTSVMESAWVYKK